MSSLPSGKLEILRYPDPILSRRCDAVELFGPNLRDFANRMLDCMREHEGVGLAAPQVGVAIRLFVCNVTGEPDDDMIFVNPKFDKLEGAADAQEGCLSLPIVTVTMRRATIATITAQDTEGQSFTRSSEDLAPRVWQHEVDHLDGKLIIDRMSTSDEIANRRLLKQLKETFASARR